ncbi:MAG: shikimate dehydrogenase [Candidatus Omnitrophota bacterium]|nr:shikimate dehydrogenase [Candidatus Omnitrophota bacterium]
MNINGKTEIYGLIGYPVKHTFSPAMHNAAFRSLGMNAVYLPLEVKPGDLKSVISCVKSLGVSGLNVTVPHKEKIVRYLDDVDKEASLIKAVNTIVNEGAKLKGFNTDGRGFVKSLKEEFGILPRGKRFFIMGAGGAARAISFSIALEGAGRIILVDAVKSKAVKLANALTRNTSCEAIALKNEKRAMKELILGSDVLINATPCGMKASDRRLLDPNLLHRRLCVYDIIYNPRATMLLRDARNKGARVANGMGMLLNQGVISFNLWTGRRAPVRVMKKALTGII